jgi:hypothetical protein
MRHALIVSGFILGACQGEPAAHYKLRDAGSQPVIADPAHSVCNVDADCVWSDIDHEIHKVSQCACVYSCPRIPLSNETALRRIAQREGVCEPQPPGIQSHCDDTDCDAPPPIACIEGLCGEAHEPDAS